MAKTVRVPQAGAAEDLAKLRDFYQGKLDAATLPASPVYWPVWATEAQRWIRALDQGIAAIRRLRVK